MVLKVKKQFLKAVDINIFKRILRDCLDVGSETLLIVGDYGKEDNLISAILTNGYSVAAKDMGLNYKTVFENLKIRGEMADYVLRKQLNDLPRNSSIIINATERIGYLGENKLSLRRYCKEHGHRFLSASSLGTLKGMMYKPVLKSLDVDYKSLEKNALRIKKTLDNAREIHITSPCGTDVLLNVEGVSSLLNTGDFREFGTGGNMPCGEVFIAPNKDHIDGRIVVDGSSRHKDGTILIKEPIIIEVEKGVITKITGGYEAKLLKDSIAWAHLKAKYPRGVWRIGEFGIGLNQNADIIGAMIVDEKTLGTSHFAVGGNDWFGGEVSSIIHLDQVFHKPRIRADGRLITV